MNRRTFIGAAGAFALTGCRTSSESFSLGGAMPHPDFAWSFLAHFGMNMWGDIETPPKRDGLIVRNLTDEEFAAASTPEAIGHDHVRFDECLWRDLTERLKKDGCNQIVIDVGEFLKYPSHPELAVKGSWEPDRLAAEVARLADMGFEVVPKLNFSCCHHAWLGPYVRVVSTPKYYEVCSDLIRDTLEVFKGTRYLHLGFEEEHEPSYQRRSSLLIIRHHDLWWHDLLWFVREVEKRGVRAWIWHDYCRKHDIADFEKRMPKTVVQSPWSYMIGKQTKMDMAKVNLFELLAAHGYDTVPCSSNCYGSDISMPMMEKWSREHLDKRHYKGFMMAPWMSTTGAYRRLLMRSSEIIAETKKIAEGR